MARPRKYNSGIVWIESSRGNMNPTSFNVTGTGATKKELKEMVEKMVPAARSVTIVVGKGNGKT